MPAIFPSIERPDIVAQSDACPSVQPEEAWGWTFSPTQPRHASKNTFVAPIGFHGGWPRGWTTLGAAFLHDLGEACGFLRPFLWHLDPDIEKIVTALHDRLKVDYIAPGHCTGEPAFAALKKAFGDRYVYAGLGTTLTLNTPPH
jgi:hypothetical protein